MVWDKLKKLVGIKNENSAESASSHDSSPPSKPSPATANNASEAATTQPAVAWVNAESNPWGVPILDVRPVTLTITSTSSDKQCAFNAVSYGSDDGSSFIGQPPKYARIVSSNLTFRVDRLLADGVLFAPGQMEHKWAIFYREGKIIFVRGWLREVFVIAKTKQENGRLTITEIQGSFVSENEDTDFTERVLDYLLRSHALNLPYPAPLPSGMENDAKAAAMWCFSGFGNMAQCATSHHIGRQEPTAPLRAISLLHIAVARGDVQQTNAALEVGIPADLLASDGLAPLHWALVKNDPMVMDRLLANGSSVDVRSLEGATPLMNAAQGNNIDAVSLLLGRGADVNAKDLRGFTALHRAAEMGHLDVAKALLVAGASPDVEAQGHTPRSLAEMRGVAAMIALLQP